MNICITIDSSLDLYSVQEAALVVSNKVAFDKSKGYSRSWDGQTYWEFAGNLTHQVGNIVKKLKRGTYEFAPCLRKTRQIGSRKRNLHVSVWSDKIVEIWLSNILNRHLKKWFVRDCYAYKPGDSLGVCHSRITKTLAEGSKFIIRRDIKDFFNNINHDQLLGLLDELISDEYLFKLISQRVRYQYHSPELCVAEKGVPFGSALACVLSNIALTPTDKEMVKTGVNYFRYADDYLMTSQDGDLILGAERLLNSGLASIGLSYNESKRDNHAFVEHPGFTHIKKFKYLGIEHHSDGTRRFPVEKRRKIIHMCKRALASKKIANVGHAVESINAALKTRIRNAAIVDYYLGMVTDERQLKEMDEHIRELIVSSVTGKKFRRSHYKLVPPREMYRHGLISLQRRSQLIRNGTLKVSFLSLFNRIQLERHVQTIERRADRLDQMAAARKLRKNTIAQK